MLFLSFQQPTIDDSLNCSQLEILKIVHSYDQPGWSLHSHSHTDQAEILYIAGGEGIYTVDNIPYHVQSGDIVVFNSNVVHSLESGLQQPLDVWACSLRGFQLDSLPMNHILPESASPVLPAGDRSPFILALYQELSRQKTGETTGYYPICQALSHALLLLCYQLSLEQLSRSQQEKVSFAADVLSYLDTHYAKPITMDSLSQHFHISASHISHEVRRVYHISPINYLIDRRIRQAQWELASTENSLKDIALHVGYENPNHFSSLFLKHTGMKPLEFRQNYTEQKKKS